MTTTSLIEPNIVCENILNTRDNKIAYTTILRMNDYSHYYIDKLNKLEIIIEYDDTIIEKMRYDGDGEVEHEATILKLTIDNDNELAQPHKRLGLLTYSLLDLHSSSKHIIKAKCNHKPVIVLKTTEYIPTIN